MKQIAVVCNYKLNPARIGGMDRFFVAFDQKCRKNSFSVKWFFSGGKVFDFYKDLDIEICPEVSVENCFLNFQQENNFKFDFVVTHFVELCTQFFKEIRKFHKPFVISVDHNPRPINGFPLRSKSKTSSRENCIRGILISL